MRHAAAKSKKSRPGRAMWSGSISFGLVNIPIVLLTAVRSKDVHFHLLHDQDKSRLQRKLICVSDHREVPQEHIIKGYEVSPGHYIPVDDNELEAIAPKASRAIDILYFADLDDIDPIYFQHPFYVLPDERAEKSYALFVEALEKAGKVGIARFVMRSKEYVAALRTREGILLLETLYHGDEVVAPGDLSIQPPKAKAAERELKVAQQLIDSLSAPFEPAKLKDEYRDAVLELVEKKSEGQDVVVAPEEAPKKTEVSDILAALEASLANAKKKRDHKAEPAGAGRHR